MLLDDSNVGVTQWSYIQSVPEVVSDALDKLAKNRAVQRTGNAQVNRRARIGMSEKDGTKRWDKKAGSNWPRCLRPAMDNGADERT
jgi:hypothetical protein